MDFTTFYTFHITALRVIIVYIGSNIVVNLAQLQSCNFNLLVDIDSLIVILIGFLTAGSVVF